MTTSASITPEQACAAYRACVVDVVARKGARQAFESQQAGDALHEMELAHWTERCDSLRADEQVAFDKLDEALYHLAESLGLLLWQSPNAPLGALAQEHRVTLAYLLLGVAIRPVQCRVVGKIGPDGAWENVG